MVLVAALERWEHHSRALPRAHQFREARLHLVGQQGLGATFHNRNIDYFAASIFRRHLYQPSEIKRWGKVQPLLFKEQTWVLVTSLKKFVVRCLQKSISCCITLCKYWTWLYSNGMAMEDSIVVTAATVTPTRTYFLNFWASHNFSLNFGSEHIESESMVQGKLKKWTAKNDGNWR